MSVRAEYQADVSGNLITINNTPIYNGNGGGGVANTISGMYCDTRRVWMWKGPWIRLV